MATPLSAAQFQSALQNEGLKVFGLPGWETHNRNSKGAWGPMNGVVIHHTGSDTSDPLGYVKNILWSGYAGLPGPLCHSGISVDGTVYLTGYGRANHAGGGGSNSLAAVQAESYTGELHPNAGNSNGVDGNSHFYGVEVMYSGGHPMAAAQRDAAVRWAAALCRAHGWSAKSVIGHREWSSDKVDPGHEDMNVFRADVQKRLDGAPVSVTKPAVPATPSKPASTAKYAYFTRDAVTGAIYGMPRDGSGVHHLTPSEYAAEGSPAPQARWGEFARFIVDYGQGNGAIVGIHSDGTTKNLGPAEWVTYRKAGAEADIRWDEYYTFVRDKQGNIYGVKPSGERTHLTPTLWNNYAAHKAVLRQL